MECVKYSQQEIDEIIHNGFDFKLPEITINMIADISEKVGAPSYIKTPVFQKKRRDERKKKRSDEQLPPLIPTVFKVKTDDKNISILSKITCNLNKMTDKTYEKLLPIVFDDIEELEINNEILKKISDHLFMLLSNQIIFSHIYAHVYNELSKKYNYMNELLNNYIDSYIESYENISDVEIDPDENYNAFCNLQKNNEMRKARSKFITDLVNMNVIEKDRVEVIIETLQFILKDMLYKDNLSKCCEELSANISIFVTNIKNLQQYTNYNMIVEEIKNVSIMKVKEVSSLTSKILFKQKDLDDYIKKLTP